MGWAYEIDGADLVIRNITGTCFGGRFDKGDTGQTESGFNNSGNGSVEANTPQCALPIRSTEKATSGSPLAFKGAHIPWLSVVMVWREADGESTAIKTILTDNGPDYLNFPSHALDLNPPAVQKLGTRMALPALANSWSESGISYRIIDGARWIS